jgi:hypothetical protein
MSLWSVVYPERRYLSVLWGRSVRIKEVTMTEKNNIKGRDKDYRIAALKCAIARAGQDGGLEGKIDVMGLAEDYYMWLKGHNVSEKPALEKQ